MKKIIFTVFCATVSFSNSSIAAEKAFVLENTFSTFASQAAVMTAQSSPFEKQLLRYRFLFDRYLAEVVPITGINNLELIDHIKNNVSTLLNIYKCATNAGQWIEEKSDFEPYFEYFFGGNRYNMNIFYDKVTAFLKNLTHTALISERDLVPVLEELANWMKEHSVLERMAIPDTIPEENAESLL